MNNTETNQTLDCQQADGQPSGTTISREEWPDDTAGENTLLDMLAQLAGAM